MKKQLIITALLISSFTTFAQANKLMRQAERSTDLQERIELCNQVIGLDPKNLDAYFLRGLTKNDLGDFYGAIVDYSKIIVLQPDPDTYYNRGNSRYALGDFENAKQDYKKAYELDPNFIDALYSQGCAEYDLGQYEDAAKTFHKIVINYPSDTKAIYRLAESYNALKQYRNALNNYTLAVTIDRTSTAFYNRGVFLMSINYYKDALSDFEKAIRRDNTNSYAYFFKGTAQLFLGDFTKASADYNTVLKYDALDFDAMLGLAISNYKMNDLQNAKLFFEKAGHIIDPDRSIESINHFKDTYWFNKQYYYFSEIYNELVKL
ncbi:tetratricopeptide repeat protein [Aestuariibaculum suncheonense]|uniref:Tetratricopeptide repeat protein n=1 Tax=Aestuariibaculum suncheonense TaxID=1028745 RepID=A0A8J6QH31_9FLAO|nr:tetratricopeptide repeat protein [Aestuariibaculum suncheonense]MBD0836375.1 tetratricopeptide repeat protein [Aestuariibaculum suncheonense]